MNRQDINRQIAHFENEIRKLREKESKLAKIEIKSFDEINWSDIYDTIVNDYIEPELSSLDDDDIPDDDLPTYLYEYIITEICPNFFKK